MKFIIYAILTQRARAENLKSRSVGSIDRLKSRSAIASWIHSYFDNVMTKFMINNRTDARKTDVNLLIYRLSSRRRRRRLGLTSLI